MRSIKCGTVLVAVGVLLVSTACRHQLPTIQWTQIDAVSATTSAPTVSQEEYAAALPATRIVVGFDVDDTALFSTPAFLYAKGRLIPEQPSQSLGAEAQVREWRRWVDTLADAREVLFERLVTSDGNDLTPHDRAQWERLWVDVNYRGDMYSPPKAVARNLVRLHLARADEVVFVTARANMSGASLVSKLRTDFGSERIRVEFTGNRPKRDVIAAFRFAIYYGDADSDITEATAAKARGVRILRSRYSSNPTPTHPGQKGEWCVIRDSDR